MYVGVLPLFFAITILGHTDLVRTLHFNGDRIVSASYDLSIRVWDIR